jgi:PHB/PHA accumulation regulator DNA-binding domain
MPTAPRRFKKFSNRKLYDLDGSRYVSMLELAKVTASGPDVVVEDDRTGRDITLETLARALYELLKDHLDGGDRRRRRPDDPFSHVELARLIRKVPVRSVAKAA